MHRTHERATARGWRPLLIAAACAATVALAAGHAETASADCTTGGSGCLPGTGWSYEPSPWSCSVASGVSCYFNGTTSPGSAVADSWGWGSAAYNAGGVNVSVCVYGGVSFYGCGVNIARACYFANCNDQNSRSFLIDVANFTGTYVIWGSAKA